MSYPPRGQLSTDENNRKLYLMFTNLFLVWAGNKFNN